MKNNMVKLVEAFNSFQGEGPDVGKKMMFLRMKLCQRDCIWCDTKLKLRISQEFEISISDIQKSIDEWETNLCITGGEPSFSINLDQTINLINNLKCNLFNIETNGFNLIGLIEKVDKNKNVNYSLSPKLFTEKDYIFYTDLVQKIKNNNNVYIKLVYEDRDLINNFLDYLTETNFDSNRIFLMPEGKTKEEILEHAPLVFDMAEKYKTNFSSREHIIYGFV